MIHLDMDKVKQLENDYLRWFDSDRSADNFTALLFAIIIKADIQNAFKLAQAFPEEVYAVSKYQEKPVLSRFIANGDAIVLF